MSHDTDIAARLAAVEARLAELEDREAIRNLIASYGPLADSGDAAGVAALWCEDGVYAVGGFGEYTGQVAIAELINGPTHQQLMKEGCAHLLGPVHVELRGDVAVAVGHSCVFRHSGSSFEVYRASANRWELRKRAGQWRVTRRSNRPLNGNEAATALLALGG